MNRIEKLSSWFVLITGWKRMFAALIAGLFSALSMPPFYLFPILFITLPVFVWLMDGVYGDGSKGIVSKLRSAFFVGWWFGFGYFVAGLWWIGNALLVEAETFAWAIPFAVLALPAAIAIFWGFAAILARLVWHDGSTRILSLTLGLGVAEFLRGTLFTGFPWNTIGYAIMPIPAAMQSASVVGTYGVSLLAVIICSAPLVFIATNKKNLSARIMLAFAIALGTAHFGYGMLRLSTNPTSMVENVTVRLIQPAINQQDKFDLTKEDEIISTYFELSNANSTSGREGLSDTNYVIWPESSFPFLLTERRDVLASIGEMLPQGSQLITGAMRAEPSAAGNPYGSIYNSVYLINDVGEIVDATDKVHLVPFGEYLPMQETLESFGLQQLTRQRGGFEQGADRGVLTGNTASSFLPLICYEIIFPGQILRSGMSLEERPSWIVNLTNDAWYGFTPGPFQHFHQSVVRGVEEGLPVIRVANSGVSGVSDPYGRIIAKLGLGKKGIIDTSIPKKASLTIFAQYGNSLFFILSGLLAIFSIFLKISKRR